MVADGQGRREQEPVPGPVTGVGVGSWQGREVVVAAGAGSGLRCWTVPDGDPVPTTPLPWPPLAVTLAPTGELWALGAEGVATIERSRSDEQG